MKFNSYKIEIDPGPDPRKSHFLFPYWVNRVAGVIRKLESTKAGKLLLESAGSGPDWIKVSPLNFDNVCGAHSSGIGGGWISKKNNQNGRVTTFAGIIKFDPDVFNVGSPCHFKKYGNTTVVPPGGSADEVFFHEFIHAYRYSRSRGINQRLNNGMIRYTTFEEFVAVVATNVYISDITNKPSRFLRAAHQGKYFLEKELSGSIAFYRSSPQVLTLMESFYKNDKKFFEGLAKVEAWFNPFWSYIHKHDDVVKASRSPESKWRERTDEARTIKRNSEDAKGVKKRTEQLRSQQPPETKGFFESMLRNIESIVR